MDKQFLQEKEQEFIEQGYVIYKNLYSQEAVNKMSNLIFSLISMTDEISYPHDQNIHKIDYHGTQFVLQYKENHTIIHRIVWASGAQPELLTFSRSPELLAVVSTLLQANKADHLINSIHSKLPNDLIEFKIHQDAFHRKNFDPEWSNLNKDRSYVVCVTAIDAMSLKNGGIYIIPQSHQVNRILSTFELNTIDINQAIAPTLDPGDTLCMNQYLVHFSLPNESECSRNLLINGFSVVGANHEPYPGKGSAQLIELSTNETLSNLCTPLENFL